MSRIILNESVVAWNVYIVIFSIVNSTATAKCFAWFLLDLNCLSYSCRLVVVEAVCDYFRFDGPSADNSVKLGLRYGISIVDCLVNNHIVSLVNWFIGGVIGDRSVFGTIEAESLKLNRILSTGWSLKKLWRTISGLVEWTVELVRNWDLVIRSFVLRKGVW